MKETTQAQRVIGLDAHPYLFSAAALSGPDALQSEVQWVVDREPLERLVPILRRRLQPGDVVALEASGNSFAVAEKLAQIGAVVVVLESQSVGRVGSTYCATDKLDAVKIARVYLSGLARVVWRPDAETLQRRELYYMHRSAVCDAVRARNRIWAWFNGHGRRRPRGVKLAQPQALRHLLALHPWTETECALLSELVTAFQQAEARRTRLRGMIATEVAADPHILQMVRLLGIRHVIAFALAAFIGPIERFGTPRKLVAFFGLNPRVSRSGISGGNGRLSHYGRADVRALLIQAAQSILRYGEGPTHRWAVALKMRKGTCVAVAALARKLVVSVWYLLNGRFTPLTEVPPRLRLKIHKLVEEIAPKALREHGCKSRSDYERRLVDALLSTA